MKNNEEEMMGKVGAVQLYDVSPRWIDTSALGEGKGLHFNGFDIEWAVVEWDLTYEQSTRLLEQGARFALVLIEPSDGQRS